MKKTLVLTIAVIAVFGLSMVAEPTLVSGAEFVETNFKLDFYIPSGSRRDESYALYIKQAVAPLGIDVKIFAKPWGQFVGELYGYTGQSYDMMTVGFTGGPATPRFRWLYHSENQWAIIANHLNAPGFAEWQLQDTGVNQTELDQQLTDIDLEFNMTKRQELFQAFNDLYFDKLLYNPPLVAPQSRVAVWKGWGGDDAALWDVNEGTNPIYSQPVGAKWESNRPTRAAHSNTSTFRYAIPSPSLTDMDPFQGGDSAKTNVVQWLSGGTVSFDGNWGFRPDWAWQFVYGDFGDMKLVDYDNDYSTAPTEEHVWRATVFLRDDAMWADTIDKDGNPVSGRAVNAKDVELVTALFDYYQQRTDLYVNGEDNYDQVVGWEINSTLRADDTFTVFLRPDLLDPDSQIVHVGMGGYPAFLLGNLGDDIHYTNTTGTYTFQLAPDMAFDAFDSDEWNSFETLEGNTGTGYYEMVEKVDGQYYSYRLRDDYYYPNLWDLPTYYGDGSAMASWEAFTGRDLSIWGGDAVSYPQEAFFWTYADNPATTTVHEKPTTMGAETLYVVVIDDDNAELIEFEAGRIDIFGSASLGSEVVSRHTNSADLVVKATYPEVTARMLFFNINNEHLKKLNVRKAITLAIDRSALIEIHEGFAQEWWSTAYTNKQTFGVNWDLIQSPMVYSYEQARDLMILEGYDAAEFNTYVEVVTPPAPGEVLIAIGGGDVGSNTLFFFSSFAMISVVLIRKRRK